MTRAELLSRLEEASIDPRSYDLDECLGDTYVVLQNEGKWQVFYFERGIKRGLRMFEDEADANTFFFDLVSDDPTTRLK